MSTQIEASVRRRVRFYLVAIFAGVILYLITFTAALPWRVRPPDEVAVVVAAPIIAVIISVEILVYALDMTLVVVLRGIIKRTGTRVSNVLQVPAVELQGTLSKAVLIAVLCATVGLAFLITVALLAATGIGWTLQAMKIMGVGLVVVTGLVFLYGWVRGVLDRQAASQPSVFEMSFPAYRLAITLLWCLRMAGAE